ncbi:MAG: DUF350 domain-containing protein [Bacteroidia bacterium]|nr:DUF350 domain-containing protein [Bacteroidia bacterium]
MPDFLPEPTTIIVNTLFILSYIGLFFFAKWLKGAFSSYNLDEQLTHYDNNAVSVSTAGYFVGVTAVFIGAIVDPAPNLTLAERAAISPNISAFDMDTFLDLSLSVGIAIAGILLLHGARLVNRKLILTEFSVDKEIIKDQNPGTGVVEAASYIASGLIIAGALHGEGSNLFISLVFFILGQLCLILFARIYAKLTPYSVHDEIEKDNLAAGLGFAGGLISIGIIVMQAVSGNFSGWVEDLSLLAVEVLVVFVYLIAVRFIFDKFILRNSDLNTEIAQDQNIGAGLLEMVVAICFSLVLFFII